MVSARNKKKKNEEREDAGTADRQTDRRTDRRGILKQGRQKSEQADSSERKRGRAKVKARAATGSSDGNEVMVDRSFGPSLSQTPVSQSTTRAPGPSPPRCKARRLNQKQTQASRRAERETSAEWGKGRDGERSFRPRRDPDRVEGREQKLVDRRIRLVGAVSIPGFSPVSNSIHTPHTPIADGRGGGTKGGDGGACLYSGQSTGQVCNAIWSLASYNAGACRGAWRLAVCEQRGVRPPLAT
ncbi:hypothetical protein IWX46DRAFT_578379 [Phyllosticta citricarpa]|uniref:Uncharacterized protein n=1 Tax=Phyllosticta citricarpa TaxID=55181 RepID=A0ABR1MKS9_9PEZI